MFRYLDGELGDELLVEVLILEALDGDLPGEVHAAVDDGEGALAEEAEVVRGRVGRVRAVDANIQPEGGDVGERGEPAVCIEPIEDVSRDGQPPVSNAP